MAKEMMCMHKKKGIGMFVLGLLILWNVYWPFVDWGAFVGGAMALAGLLMMIMPHKHMMMKD